METWHLIAFALICLVGAGFVISQYFDAGSEAGAFQGAEVQDLGETLNGNLTALNEKIDSLEANITALQAENTALLQAQNNAINESQFIFETAINGSITHSQILTHKTPEVYNALAVQNAWVTIFNHTECRIISGWVSISGFTENVGVRVTVDNVTYTGADTITAGGNRYLIYQPIDGTINISSSGGTNINGNVYQFSGHTVLIEFRKTTNAGASNIQSRFIWEGL